ncbi:MAG: hypothetical protein AAF206_07390 [Bacteroidota bacterium]
MKWGQKYWGEILLGIGFLVFYIWARTWLHEEKFTAYTATRWMNIFGFGQFEQTTDLWQYLKELRTGIPPVLSWLEIRSFLQAGRMEDIHWLIRNAYQFAMIAMLLLSALWGKWEKSRWLYVLLISAILLPAIAIVHKGNAQIYDVMLPFFLMLHLVGVYWGRKWFDKGKGWKIVGMGLAIFAGLSLSLAELSRPFMLAVVPFVLLHHFFQDKSTRKSFLIVLLLPVLLVSGGWHIKLMIYNQGQLIWSNHGGCNLANAWAPVIDHQALNAKIQPEEPPLVDNQWTWDNINTQIHTDNCKEMQRAVVQGILKHPGKAFAHISGKAWRFLLVRTDMYAYDPQGWQIDAYRWIVRLLYLNLIVLLLVYLRRAWKKPAILLSEAFLLLFLAAFLTFMPIIGENGEEARFLVSIVPLLVASGMLGLKELQSLRSTLDKTKDAEARPA